METRLTRKDLAFIGGCVLIAAVSLAVGVHYFYRAFPEASIDFRVTRDEAKVQAADFIAARGFDLADYRHGAIFRYDDQTKTFLERELGLEGATQVIGHPVQLWRWSNRWMRELKKEEFQATVTTSGELVSFSHLIEEEAPGASLEEAEARRLAEVFLTAELGRDLTALEFVEVQTQERPNRIDHTFSWKLRGFAVGEAYYRFYVRLQGDQIGGFGEYLKIPEAWERDYAELRSHNETTGLVAATLLFLTILAMLVSFFSGVRARDIRWKTAAIFGAIAAVLTLLAELNNLPLTSFSYDTTDTYGSFLTRQLLNSLFAAVVQGILIFFLTAAAEPLYRRYCADQIQIGGQFTPAGLRTKRFLLGTILGLAMTPAFLAYQVLFYITAEQFGAWGPADIPYSEMVNTYIPWIMVLLIGFMPAVSEEFISRAFSIPFLHKYLKFRWVAVVIAGLIWGFAHANYPQQPFYIRGIEVGIAGIVVGYIFLRFGILAPLVWHYTIDALYTSLILFRSSNSYFIVSAALSAGLMLLPLAVALVLYLRQRRFADPTPLLNKSAAPAAEVVADEPSAQQPAAPAPAFAYTPLSKRRMGWAAVVVVVSLGFFALDYEKPLDFVDVRLTRGEAEAKAIEHLEATGADASAYEVVTYYQNQPDAMAIRYILERDSVAVVNRLYREDLLASLWVTRFFRYGEKEEYQVAIHPADGSLYSVNHLLAEEAEGADLEEAHAQAIAVDHLRAYGFAVEQLKLKESSSEKLPNRRDHRFVFEAVEGDPRNVDELRYRVRVNIAGDEPVAIYRFLKVPEDWRRTRQESTTLKTALSGLLIVLVAAVVIHGLWLLVRRVRNEGVAWTPLVKIAAVAATFFLLEFLNGLSVVERAYDTRLTLPIFTITQILSMALGSLGVGLVILAALGLASSLYPDWPARLRAARRVPEFRDAVVGVALILVAREAWQHLRGYVESRFIASDPSLGFGLPAGLDPYLPFWSPLSNGVTNAIFLPIIAGLALYYSRVVMKKRLYAVVAGLGVGLIMSGGNAVHFDEFLFELSAFVASVGFVVAAIVLLLRNNLLAYVLLGFVSVLSEVKSLGALSAPAYQSQAGILLLLTLVVVFCLWWRLGAERD